MGRLVFNAPAEKDPLLEIEQKLQNEILSLVEYLPRPHFDALKSLAEKARFDVAIHEDPAVSEANPFIRATLIVRRNIEICAEEISKEVLTARNYEDEADAVLTVLMAKMMAQVIALPLRHMKWMVANEEKALLRSPDRASAFEELLSYEPVRGFLGSDEGGD